MSLVLLYIYVDHNTSVYNNINNFYILKKRDSDKNLLSFKFVALISFIFFFFLTARIPYVLIYITWHYKSLILTPLGSKSDISDENPLSFRFVALISLTFYFFTAKILYIREIV